MDISKTILVAGAGIAGLACATCLLEAGYKVILLEASPRYGGRIKSLDSNKWFTL